MKLKPLLLSSLIALLTFTAAAQQKEDDYVQLIQKEMGGQTEASVSSGYIDLLTDTYAIEVDFARKWKQSIGQALWYGLQTNKIPGIILIKESETDDKYVIQLCSALQYAQIDQKVRVWIWPDDFGRRLTSRQKENKAINSSPVKTYWLTLSGKKRHNNSCKYYKKSRGRVCNKNEGEACKICGG